MALGLMLSRRKDSSSMGTRFGLLNVLLDPRVAAHFNLDVMFSTPSHALPLVFQMSAFFCRESDCGILRAVYLELIRK
jgi:hypothetical protein